MLHLNYRPVLDPHDAGDAGYAYWEMVSGGRVLESDPFQVWPKYDKPRELRVLADLCDRARKELAGDHPDAVL